MLKVQKWGKFLALFVACFNVPQIHAFQSKTGICKLYLKAVYGLYTSSPTLQADSTSASIQALRAFRMKVLDHSAISPSLKPVTGSSNSRHSKTAQVAGRIRSVEEYYTGMGKLGSNLDEDRKVFAVTLKGEKDIKEFMQSMEQMQNNKVTLSNLEGLMHGLGLGAVAGVNSSLVLYKLLQSVGLANTPGERLLALTPEFLVLFHQLRQITVKNELFQKKINQFLSNPQLRGWEFYSTEAYVNENKVKILQNTTNQRLLNLLDLIPNSDLMYALADPIVGAPYYKKKLDLSWVGIDALFQNTDEGPQLTLVVRDSKKRPKMPQTSSKPFEQNPELSPVPIFIPAQ